MTNKRAYLEEDCDAGTDIDSLPYSYSDYAKCRFYTNYDPKWIHEPFGIGREVWVNTTTGGKYMGTITELRKGHYIVETMTFKYGIPASNPLKYCTPA
jgi:hypothetical protein